MTIAMADQNKTYVKGFNIQDLFELWQGRWPRHRGPWKNAKGLICWDTLIIKEYRSRKIGVAWINH